MSIFYRRFTLVELTVVISILALLSMLLVPHLSSALENSREISCRNNQGKIYICAEMYSENNDGNILPFTWEAALFGDGITSVQKQPFTCPNASTSYSYGINLRLVNIPDKNDPRALHRYPKYKRHDIDVTGNSAITSYFMDSSDVWVQHAPPSSGRIRWDARHKNGLIVLWMDGHVSWAHQHFLADSNRDGIEDTGYFNFKNIGLTREIFED